MARDMEELEARLRQAEERLAQGQKMAALGRLTGSIARLQQPAHGDPRVRVAPEDYLPEGGEGHEAADCIERSARRASELTRQLLAYARGETPPEGHEPDR